ncbi:restriction endonuclease subunit S [Pseudomonas paraeruginosa]|uniref:restriction endonuclease subunit S n=1 Tax=Pseudomonas paraeruginosa TaxID=2994495 RepID=UPI0039FC4452
MEKEDKAALVPKLRFPEFRNAGLWNRLSLSELLRERKQRNRDLRFGPSEVLSVSGDHGCVNQIELLGRSYAGASVKEYHVVETGDLVYTKSPLKRNPYGIIKENKGKPGIVSTLYAVYHVTKQGHPAYLDHFFSSDYNLNSYLQPIVRKGAKNDMKVNNAAVLTGEIWAPQMEEQRKIADCLNSLDELISAQRHKVEALKIYKRGLMQQLFPREGETLPRLRFPEFRNAREWEEGRLGDLFDTTSGGTPDRAKKDYWIGAIPWITTSLIDFNVISKADEFISEAGLKNSSAKVFPKDTVLIAMYGQGKTRGKVAILGIAAATNQACAAILPNDKIDQRFTFVSLCGRYEEMRALSNSGGQENLSQGLIRGLPFRYPKDVEEQSKIVEFFSSIDARIVGEVGKLDVLKTHKESLLQQLFPSLKDVT